MDFLSSDATTGGVWHGEDNEVLRRRVLIEPQPGVNGREIATSSLDSDGQQ